MDLRRLSNFYKHQGLIVVKKEVDQIEPFTLTGKTQWRARLGNEMNVDHRLPFIVGRLAAGT